MATPTATDLYFQQGATLGPVLSKSVNGTPVDWTGYTARMQVRPNVDSSTVYLSLTTENGGIAINGSNIALTPGLVSGNPLGNAAGAAFGALSKGVYDLEMIAPNGKITKPFFGIVELIRAITK